MAVVEIEEPRTVLNDSTLMRQDVYERLCEALRDGHNRSDMCIRLPYWCNRLVGLSANPNTYTFSLFGVDAALMPPSHYDNESVEPVVISTTSGVPICYY